jgi:hypothetical protein
MKPAQARRQSPGAAGATVGQKTAVGAVLSPKRGKYGAVATVVNGHRFPSKREAARYQTLTMLERLGEIRHLRLQVGFDLHEPGGVEVGKYVADFTYEQASEHGWLDVVEDAKGVRTALYRWKKKHAEAEYGIEIRET